MPLLLSTGTVDAATVYRLAYGSSCR